MNILIIGSGGREHAIADALCNPNNVLYCLPGNPGIWQIAQKIDIKINDFENIKNFCLNENIQLVVIGPEQPLAMGLTNFLENNGINVFGPTQEAAMLETSKSFAKKIMFKNNIPTAHFVTFEKHQFNEAIEFISNISKSGRSSKYHTEFPDNNSFANDFAFNFPIVLKADGLAAGKGVVICHTAEEAENEITQMFEGKFGEASSRVVIEEFLQGEEVSIFAITDGKDYFLLSPAQDHKKIYDNDMGKNTGGMGAYSPVPFLDKILLEIIEFKIIRPIILAMNEEGTPFKGCLYAGLILTSSGPKVIEFNARFGDPETQSVLRLIDGDFTQLLYSVAIGNLDKNAIKITNEFACCVVLASQGYPDNYETGFDITGLDKIYDSEVKIYHSGTKIENDKLLTNGGRVLTVSVKDTDYKKAIGKAYFYANLINFGNKYYRKDIGAKVIKYYK
ncbi:MAG: phosphoribosylamine--glycine ligase [Chloroherpetonaceae bacterium]